MIFFSNIINRFISRYIIYTKFLQWINFDFLSFLGPKINIFLRNFTNKAPYVDDDIDYESIIKLENIGKKYDISIDKIPINSGTISLVFKGKINHNGTNKDIAVKILRCNIKNKINNAILNIEFILSFIKYVFFFKNINKIFKDIKNSLLEQIDFNNEVKNIKLFHSRLNKHSLIKTIKVIDELTMDNFIVMEFIYGKSIFHLSSDERKEFTSALSTTTFYTQMKKMLYHLDLHPGNILWTNDNKICYLDLGMIMKLKVEECNFILDINKIIFSIDGNVLLLLQEAIDKHKDIIFEETNITNNFARKIVEKRPNIFGTRDNLAIILDIQFLMKELNSSGYELNERINKIFFGYISFISIFVNLGEDIYTENNKNIDMFT